MSNRSCAGFRAQNVEMGEGAMNLSNQIYVLLGLVLALPMAVVALLNWLLRNRGGFARGWAGAIFVAMCWIAGMILIVTRIVE